MGCGDVKDKLEDKMMLIKIERMELRMQREKELKKLADMDGHQVKKNEIPDYIDPVFAQEKKIYEVSNVDSDTDKNKRKKSKKKKK